MIFEVPKSDSHRIGFSDKMMLDLLPSDWDDVLLEPRLQRSGTFPWEGVRAIFDTQAEEGAEQASQVTDLQKQSQVAFPLIFPIIFPMDIPSGFNLPLGSWDIHGSWLSAPRLDSVLEGEGKKELKTPQHIQLEKKQREKNKLKQKPWLRKQRAKENKEARMKKREEQQMRPSSAYLINFLECFARVEFWVKEGW